MENAGTVNGRRKRSELVQYYEGEKKKWERAGASSKLDLLSKDFDPQLYSQKIIKECSLKQLLEEEVSLSSTAHRLDSDCQTLVYEHYDKFLHATDLVHKLKEGSSEMENQLQQLQSNMALITESSSAITAGLKERRDELSRLLNAHTTLQKLEFLFQLPDKMDECISKGTLKEGVECYLNTCEVLHRYSHLSSLASVQADCDAALDRLKAALHNTIAEGTAKSLSSSVELLLQLGEPQHTLQQSFLQQASKRLHSDLEALQDIAEPKLRAVRSSAVPTDDLSEEGYNSSTEGDQSTVVEGEEPFSMSSTDRLEKRFDVDLLVFVDRCHDTYVANLWLLISSYQEMFLSRSVHSASDKEASSSLCRLVDSSISALLEVVRTRLQHEVALCPLQCHVMAAALDKLHRRLKALETMMQQSYYTLWSMELVLESTKLQCDECLAALKLSLESNLADVRQGIASSSSVSTSEDLARLLSHLVASTAADIKRFLATLTVSPGLLLAVFMKSGVTYSSDNAFRTGFVLRQVREGTIVAFFQHLTHTLASFAGAPSSDKCGADHQQTTGEAETLCSSSIKSRSESVRPMSDKGGVASHASRTAGCDDLGKPVVLGSPITGGGSPSTASGSLLLVLARAAWDLHTSSAHYLLRECDETLGVGKMVQCVEGSAALLTPSERITGPLKHAASSLLNAYVVKQGHNLTQLLCRSVQLKDWLECGEPTGARKVVQTLKEDIDACAKQVGALYEEGSRKERSSDSSRRTYQSVSSLVVRPSPTPLSRWGGANAPLSLSKLWSDRVDIYAPVLPEKLSIVTAILKIALKSLEECLRLCTLSTQGLQQVQVDVHYLHTHLWLHVSDDAPWRRLWYMKGYSSVRVQTLASPVTHEEVELSSWSVPHGRLQEKDVRVSEAKFFTQSDIAVSSEGRLPTISDGCELVDAFMYVTLPNPARSRACHAHEPVKLTSMSRSRVCHAHEHVKLTSMSRSRSCHAHEHVTLTSLSRSRARHAHEPVTLTSPSRSRARHAHEHVTLTSPQLAVTQLHAKTTRKVTKSAKNTRSGPECMSCNLAGEDSPRMTDEMCYSEPPIL
ncbi:hypothetical protein FHG87_005028 [Trinorchestia longiramus]|nr:hypothetical protein FHG87_005028 [Trinorchestia longiramus]